MDIDLPLTLSLIGCITGCAGLFINFHKFLSERFKLKVYYYETDNIFFDKLENSNCRTNYQGVISVNFVNKSSHPITIYDINAFIEEKKIKFDKYNGQNIELITEVFSERRYTKILISMKKQLELPLRLESYDSFKCKIFFPFFPDVTSNLTKMKFHILTAKGKTKTYCYLKKLEPKIHDN